MAEAKEELEEVNTKIYARVRRLMPWEPKKVSLKVVGDKIQNKSNKVVNEYDFDRVFEPNVENRRVFQVAVMPMISNVLRGFNAVMIAYGQTGSGKTFSMLGKPKLNIVGVLPMMLEYLVNQASVTSVELCAVEAFGHHVARIGLFDLFDPDNQTPVWGDKKSNTSLAMESARTVEITDAQDAHDKIVYAHAASHFAPTGKNPESSRGHVTFVAKVSQQKSRLESTVSYFVMVDCAGSEGESAFTPDFIAMIDKATLMARRLEAGCINTGLSALQIIFNELRVKNQLSATVGNGLRRVLHPYINTQTYLSVLFTLSPSANNARSTESTLKFAVTAGMVKVKPVATKRAVNLEQLVAELREHIAQQEKIMNDNTEKIEELNRDIEYAKNPRGRRKGGGGAGGDDDEYDDEVGDISVNMGGAGGSSKKRRAPSTVPADVMEQLNILDAEADELAALLGEEPEAHRGDRAGRVADPVSSAENESMMQHAMDASAQHNVAQQVAAVIEETQQDPEPEVIDTTEDYIRLKDVVVDELDEDELRGYAMEVTSLYEQEKIIHEGLQQSQQVIVDYLQDEYEGLLKYFIVRKILPKPETDEEQKPSKRPW